MAEAATLGLLPIHVRRAAGDLERDRDDPENIFLFVRALPFRTSGCFADAERLRLSLAGLGSDPGGSKSAGIDVPRSGASAADKIIVFDGLVSVVVARVGSVTAPSAMAS